MEPTHGPVGQIAGISKQMARRLLTIGENRLELLRVELQEERERLLHAIVLALGMAALGLLAAITLTGAIVALLWQHSPFMVLMTLTLIYSAAAAFLYRRLAGFLGGWKSFPATLDQLRKDCECLSKNLE